MTAVSNAAVPLSGLALEIAVSARSGKSRFEIRLDPADLGRIDVRIDVDRSGRVTSHLTVEKPETLSMLRQDAPQLQRALDDAGLKTGNGGLQFSLRDQSSSRTDDGNETGRNAQRLVIGDDETIPAAVAGRTYGRDARIEQRRRYQGLRRRDMTAAVGLSGSPGGFGNDAATAFIFVRLLGIFLSSTSDATLAGNFQTFLTLLTTQLQNQNPLDPLDTNQFTQQLVQFAGVEQQLKTNDQLTTLVSLQQTAQSTQALDFVGKTAVVDGSTAALTNGSATWELGVPTTSNVTVNIANSTGQTVFTGTYGVNRRQQSGLHLERHRQ